MGNDVLFKCGINYIIFLRVAMTEEKVVHFLGIIMICYSGHVVSQNINYNTFYRNKR